MWLHAHVEHTGIRGLCSISSVLTLWFSMSAWAATFVVLMGNSSCFLFTGSWFLCSCFPHHPVSRELPAFLFSCFLFLCCLLFCIPRKCVSCSGWRSPEGAIAQRGLGIYPLWACRLLLPKTVVIHWKFTYVSHVLNHKVSMTKIIRATEANKGDLILSQ